MKLFRLVFCLFRETLCFNIDLKQPNKLFRNKPKITETTLNFMKKIPKYALYHSVWVVLLFVSVQSKHRNSLFRYRTETTETNVLFRIVPNLISVVSNRNKFPRTPYVPADGRLFYCPLVSKPDEHESGCNLQCCDTKNNVNKVSKGRKK